MAASMRSALSWITLSLLRSRRARLQELRHLLQQEKLLLKVAKLQTLRLTEQHQQLRLQLEMQPPLVMPPAPQPSTPTESLSLQFQPTEQPESPFDQILGLQPQPTSPLPSET